MRRHNLIAFLVVPVVLAIIVAGACSSTVPVEIAERAAPAVTTTPGSAWDELVKAAQAEGTVNIYGAAGSEAVPGPLREAFKQRFGIDLEFMLGRRPEVIAKLFAERRAGLYLVDVAHLGDSALMDEIKPVGISVPLTGLLVSPEVTNPANWSGGRLPFIDEDRHYIQMVAYASPSIQVNTDIVKEGEIASFLDLLKPQWKGKIVFNDPTVPGPSPTGLASMFKFYGEKQALEMLRQLATQEPMISRDTRLMQEWVAQGKYPVGLGLGQSMYSEFKNAGAPVKLLMTKEPRPITSGVGYLAVLSKNPHPKATQLYINWLLGKEGQAIWSKAARVSSLRIDVSKEHLDLVFIPRADDYPQTEDFEALKLKIIKEISPKIFGHLLR